jgi:hypothetical protein
VHRTSPLDSNVNTNFFSEVNCGYGTSPELTSVRILSSVHWRYGTSPLDSDIGSEHLFWGQQQALKFFSGVNCRHRTFLGSTEHTRSISCSIGWRHPFLFRQIEEILTKVSLQCSLAIHVPSTYHLLFINAGMGTVSVPAAFQLVWTVRSAKRTLLKAAMCLLRW